MNLGSRIFVLDQYDLLHPASAAITPARLNVTGSSVRCVAADHDFDISFDGQKKLQFGIGRRILPTDDQGNQLTFSSISIYHRGAFLDNNISLVVGDAGFEDSRVALFPAQTLRVEGAGKVRGWKYAWFNPADGYYPINAPSGRVFKVNVRNLDAVNDLFVAIGSQSPADLANLVAGNGALLKAGENEDFYVAGITADWMAGPTVYTVGTVGQQFMLTWHEYAT